jgi:hypothetical protein
LSVDGELDDAAEVGEVFVVGVVDGLVGGVAETGGGADDLAGRAEDVETIKDGGDAVVGQRDGAAAGGLGGVPDGVDDLAAVQASNAKASGRGSLSAAGTCLV